MGTAASITFTSPAGGCRVQASATFDAALSGSGASDFGATDGYQIQMIEYLGDGTTYVNAEATTSKRMAMARARYSDLFTSSYSIPAGHVVTVALVLVSGGSRTVTGWAIDLRVEIIKR